MSIIESLVNPIDLYPASKSHDHPEPKYPQSGGASSFGTGGLTGKSLDSRYSSKSGHTTTDSCSLSMYKRKPKRPTGLVGPVNEVRQRVLSARQHRIRSVQNQLGDAQNHIAELINENRLLSTMQKRQELALAKYESTNAELPQLLHSHAEEIRMWQARVRLLQSQNKDLVLKLKHKDSVLLSMADQNKHLHQLNSDKHLEERERLTERVSYLEMRLQEKDDMIKVAARRSHLETKTAKSQMLIEHGKVRELQHKLDALSIEPTASSSTVSIKAKINPAVKTVNKLNPIGKVVNGENKTKTIKTTANISSSMKTTASKTVSEVAKDKTIEKEPPHSDNNPESLSTIDLLLSSSETSFTDTRRPHNDSALPTSDYYLGGLNRPSTEMGRLSNLTECSGENGVHDEQEGDDDNDVANGFFTGDIDSNYDYDEEPQWDEDVSDDDSAPEQDGDSDNSSISTNIETYRKRTPSIATKPMLTSDGQLRPKTPLADIAQLRADQRVEMMRSEAMLDTLCDSVVKKSIEPRQQMSSTTFNWSVARPSGLPVPSNSTRAPLDPKKKLMLQKALRAIDSK